MLQSSNNDNDLIYYNDQQDYSRPFFNDIRHDYQEPPPSPPLTPLSFFHLPSPCIPYDHLELQDYDIFLHQNHDLLLHHHHPHPHQQPQYLTRSFASDHTMVDVNVKEDATNYKKSQPSNSNTKVELGQGQQRKQKMMIPKNRSSKRDRHSKINTAQGPRDRRMRLSLPIAREFFDLQDKLCFDKASKTVEWLLIQARPAIKKLVAGGDGDDDGDGGGHLPLNNCRCTSTLPTKSASSTSECEVSGIDEVAATKASISKTTKPSSSSRVNNKGIKRAKASRRTALFHPRPRESREKARERARERTKEKQKLCIGQKIVSESKLCEESRNQELNQLCSWSSPFENTTACDQESGNTMNPCSDMQLPIGSSPEQDRLVPASTSENMGKWSPYPIFNHLYNSGILQEHQITDLQSYYMQVMGGL